MEPRIQLDDGLRRDLFFNVKKFIKLKTWVETANYFGVGFYTFKNYRNGRLTIPKSIFEKAIRSLPKKMRKTFIQKAAILEANWGQIKGGKRAIVTLRRRYGEEYFQSLRRKGAKNTPINKAREIIVPSEVSPAVAEILGAYLGDGTLTNHVMRISASKNLDIYYLRYLYKQIAKIFGIQPNKIRYENGRNLAYLNISSINFVNYFKKTFGLKTGDKIRNLSRIPEIILQKDSLAKSCLRGLMDTDGSICRRSTYMCLAFGSHNPVLLKQVKELGFRFGYFSHAFRVQTGSNSWKNIQRYFSEVGSSNLKHIIRFEERMRNKKFLYAKDTLKYFAQYENTKLPYRAILNSG